MEQRAKQILNNLKYPITSFIKIKNEDFIKNIYSNNLELDFIIQKLFIYDGYYDFLISGVEVMRNKFTLLIYYLNVWCDDHPSRNKVLNQLNKLIEIYYNIEYNIYIIINDKKYFIFKNNEIKIYLEKDLILKINVTSTKFIKRYYGLQIMEIINDKFKMNIIYNKHNMIEKYSIVDLNDEKRFLNVIFENIQINDKIYYLKKTSYVTPNFNYKLNIILNYKLIIN